MQIQNSLVIGEGSYQLARDDFGARFLLYFVEANREAVRWGRQNDCICCTETSGLAQNWALQLAPEAFRFSSDVHRFF